MTINNTLITLCWLILHLGRRTFFLSSSWCSTLHASRVFSHLAWLELCFGTWCVFYHGLVSLDIYEHGNHTRIHTKTISLRPAEKGGLDMIAIELWNGSLVVIKQSDPTDNKPICIAMHAGNCYLKSEFSLLMASLKFSLMNIFLKNF